MLLPSCFWSGKIEDVGYKMQEIQDAGFRIQDAEAQLTRESETCPDPSGMQDSGDSGFKVLGCHVLLILLRLRCRIQDARRNLSKAKIRANRNTGHQYGTTDES
jgi:hypothetical protein